MEIIMTDFADIPAVGDALVEEIEEDEEVESAEELEGDGKYRFNCKHIYVTWSKSKIDSKEEFYRKLLTILPAGVRMFGGPKQFTIEEDTNAIWFEKPRARQQVSDFLENTIAYCAKDGDTFGERSSLDGAVAEQKKRKWQDIIDEPDEGSAWRRVRSWISERIWFTIRLWRKRWSRSMQRSRGWRGDDDQRGSFACQS
ncbi:hypothetical protein ABVK25_006776 [Lepraria finkii]|uniref:Uncharacterized protein n=1 Tax=Lepraria finkii TaxID=1340010 RepID=A0ABR4B4N9_9LECA